MLTSIIGNDESPPPPAVSTGRRTPSPTISQYSSSTTKKLAGNDGKTQSDGDSSPERLKSKVIESLKKNRSVDGNAAVAAAATVVPAIRSDDGNRQSKDEHRQSNVE